MTHSNLTNQIALTPNQYSSRGGRKITNIVLHHTASTSGHGNGVVNMMVSGSRQVSAHYVVGSDAWVWCVVDEDYRAWSLSSANADGRSIVMECVNSTGAPSWLQSAASEEKIAQLVADICTRYNLPINRNTVVGHREVSESYPTACPGGMDLNKIVARAAQIAGSNYTAPAPAATGGYSKPVQASGAWAFNLPSSGTQARVQRALKNRARYSGPADGVFGTESIKGVQKTISQAGLYSGPIDGVAGAATCLGVQEYAAKFGSYTGPKDKILGENSWKGFALGLERP